MKFFGGFLIGAAAVAFLFAVVVNIEVPSCDAAEEKATLKELSAQAARILEIPRHGR